jgi:uncharacterized membrane protein
MPTAGGVRRVATDDLSTGGNPMATLTVWKFDTADGAQNALTTLERLQKEELIRVVDVAVVTWPADRKKPRTQDAVTDRVVENFRGTRAELISTNLSADQEAKLREAFEDAPV